MNDRRAQLEQMLKMGGMQSIMGMLPGMGGMAKAAEKAGFDDRMLKRQIALIQSMTKKERANPDLLQAARKRRIAKGAGMEVSELNKLLKQHQQMADMMKKMGKGGMMKQAIAQMMGKGGGGPAGGMPDLKNMDPAQLEAAAKAMKSGMGGLPRAMGGLSSLPSGLSGMFKKK